jgi:hypothetical protein
MSALLNLIACQVLERQATDPCDWCGFLGRGGQRAANV